MTLVKPEKLSWVTVPLIVNIVLGVLSLIALPFMGALLNSIFGAGAADPTLSADGVAGLGILQAFTGATLWITAIILIAWLALQFFALRAVQQGRNWGRIASVVVFIFALFNFPLGTILGVFGLIGAFDPDVQRYASR